MYTDADLLAIQAQQKKRWLIIGIPVAVMFVGLIVSLVVRIEWLTTALTLIIGLLLIAGYDLFIKPLHDYEIHLRNMLRGRNRTEDLSFNDLSEDISIVDGVRYWAMTAIDYDAKNKPFERLFYYDAEKPRPDFKPGEMLHIVFHDKEIVSITRLT